ncbi:MAG: hypothetical protein WAK17_17835 [Candidatus Nitrosopolaris sp.]
MKRSLDFGIQSNGESSTNCHVARNSGGDNSETQQEYRLTVNVPSLRYLNENGYNITDTSHSIAQRTVH